MGAECVFLSNPVDHRCRDIGTCVNIKGVVRSFAFSSAVRSPKACQRMRGNMTVAESILGININESSNAMTALATVEGLIVIVKRFVFFFKVLDS